MVSGNNKNKMEDVVWQSHLESQWSMRSRDRNPGVKLAGWSLPQTLSSYRITFFEEEKNTVQCSPDQILS